jgi:hypothetical protein
MAARKTTPAERTDDTPAEPYTGYSVGLEAEDVARPRMRIVSSQGDYQKMRPKMFGEGDLVIGIASDDPEADLVYESGSDSPGVLFHVLAMNKHLTSDKDAQGKPQKFQRYDIGDPDAPPNAKTVYEYTLCLPEYDTFLPVMFAFSPGSARVAQGINSALLRHQQSGAPWELAFRLTTARKQRDSYVWDAPVVVAVEPEPKHLETANAMGALVVSAQKALPAAVEEPSSF